MEEIWKDVVSRDGIYIGRYEVSNLGRVRASVNAKIKGVKPGRIICQRKDDKGYPRTNFWHNRKQTQIRVHILVAEAFIAPRKDGMTVNHIDGIKDNNRLDNLEYLSAFENSRHSYRLANLQGKYSAYGNLMCIPEAIERYGASGLSVSTVYTRIHKLGWPVETSLSTPPLKRGGYRPSGSRHYV